MKLTELILELHTLMLKEGNLEVFTADWTGISHSPVVNLDDGKVYLD